jgi:hypothetical protein
MSEFDNIFKNYLKEMDLTSSAAKAVASPQFTKTIDDAVGKMGANGAGIKALGAALMGEPHLKDLNDLLDKNNTKFNDVGDFLQKHPDLAARFAEVGMVQPKKTETTKDPAKTPTTTPVPAAAAVSEEPAYSTGAPVGG